MKSSLNDAFWTKVSIDSKKWWNTIQIIEMSAGIRNCAPSEIDHIIFELVNFDVSKIFVSYRVFYELMVNCPPQSTKWLIPPRAGIQINILHCQYEAIYWYCPYLYQYQYWFFKNCNINIEKLLAIYCQYIDRAIYCSLFGRWENFLDDFSRFFIFRFRLTENVKSESVFV